METQILIRRQQTKKHQETQFQAVPFIFSRVLALALELLLGAGGEWRGIVYPREHARDSDS